MNRKLRLLHKCYDMYRVLVNVKINFFSIGNCMKRISMRCSGQAIRRPILFNVVVQEGTFVFDEDSQWYFVDGRKTGSVTCCATMNSFRWASSINVATKIEIQQGKRSVEPTDQRYSRDYTCSHDMKGRAHPYPFAALFFSNSKRITNFLLDWQTEFSCRWLTQVDFELAKVSTIIESV